MSPEFPLIQMPQGLHSRIQPLSLVMDQESSVVMGSGAIFAIEPDRADLERLSR